MKYDMIYQRMFRKESNRKEGKKRDIACDTFDDNNHSLLETFSLTPSK